MQMGVKFEFVWKIFRLASLAFLIMKQQFEKSLLFYQRYLTKSVYGSKP